MFLFVFLKHALHHHFKGGRGGVGLTIESKTILIGGRIKSNPNSMTKVVVIGKKLQLRYVPISIYISIFSDIFMASSYHYG